MKYNYFNLFSEKCDIPKNTQPIDNTKHRDFDDSHLVSVSEFFARWNQGLPLDENSITTRYQEIEDDRPVSEMLNDPTYHPGDDILDFMDVHSVSLKKVTDVDSFSNDKVDVTSKVEDE